MKPIIMVYIEPTKTGYRPIGVFLTKKYDVPYN